MNRRFLVLGMAMLLFGCASVSGQRIAKYGSDFLAGGVDARALAMGSAFVAMTNGASSTYWNPAGLSKTDVSNVQFMHAERFAGIVSFDYGAVAIPVTTTSAVGFGMIRSAVNDIKDTRDAWDFERDVPKPNPENFFRSFSNADYAFYFSYARKSAANFSWGATGKVIYRKIGGFADAWGFSSDIGFLYHKNNLRVGLNLQDVTTMLQSWSINEAEFAPFQTEYGIPEGGTELTLPLVRIGGALDFAGTTNWEATASVDLDVAFDGQQSFAINSGDISYHPRAGLDVLFKNAVSLRAGISRVSVDPEGKLSVQPTLGAGLRVRQIEIDYAFGDFSGLTSDLGNSHMISLGLSLDARSQE